VLGKWARLVSVHLGMQAYFRNYENVLIFTEMKISTEPYECTKSYTIGWAWWLMPGILATWEREIRRIEVEASQGK
jgi:hypothetical protein